MPFVMAKGFHQPSVASWSWPSPSFKLLPSSPLTQSTQKLVCAGLCWWSPCNLPGPKMETRVDNGFGGEREKLPLYQYSLCKWFYLQQFIVYTLITQILISQVLFSPLNSRLLTIIAYCISLLGYLVDISNSICPPHTCYPPNLSSSSFPPDQLMVILYTQLIWPHT